ncbi:MAG: MFS transporter, partial [Acinetobacter oleivorans]|nr:MFS transporter [Acinetobacter oleivorans]
PVLGAFLIDYVSWHWGFVAIAAVSFMSWFGLKKFMPATQESRKQPKQPFSYIFDDFKKVFSNRRFLGLSIALPLVGMPLMLWIALSPIILVDELKLSSVQYGLAQFPVFFGLIIGNVILIKIIDRFPLGKTILMGLPIMLLGTLFLVLGVIWQAYLVPCLLIGMTLVSLGEGISFSVMYRFALMSSEVSKGTVAAAVSMLMMVSYFVIIELVRVLYTHVHIWAFALASVVLIAFWFAQPRKVLKQVMLERKAEGIN